MKACPSCKNGHFDNDDNFCKICGARLEVKEIKVFANIGKRGNITSYSYVLPGGQTINSKGKLSFNIGGISFTEDIFKI